MARARVLIVEDHALLTQTLLVALHARDLEAVEATALDFDSVLTQAADGDFDLALIDLDLGGGTSSVPLIRELARRGCRVLLVTGVTSRIALAEALEAGAVGIFRKSEPFDRLVSMVDEALRGDPVITEVEHQTLLRELRASRTARTEERKVFEQLSPREAEVLALLVGGKSAEAIASEQFVSMATVRTHIRAILAKLGVRSQLAAVAMAREAGWPWD